MTTKQVVMVATMALLLLSLLSGTAGAANEIPPVAVVQDVQAVLDVQDVQPAAEVSSHTADASTAVDTAAMPQALARQPSKRFVVYLDHTLSRGGNAVAKRNVKSLVAESGGQVVEESINPDNPFVAFEATSAEHAAGIGRAVGKAQGGWQLQHKG